MIPRHEINSIISDQMNYMQRDRTGKTFKWDDEPELRSAWLKKLFSSFDYHERLINIHYAWTNYIKNAIEVHNIKFSDKNNYDFFINKAIPNFEKVAKPGQLDPEKWIPGEQAGFANSIGYYNKDTGLDMKHTWRWLNKDDENFIFPLWGYMSEMCTNITTTVQRGWGNAIFDERYTGPIDWPANWKDDLPPELISSVGTASPEKPERVPAGRENPRTGWWFTPAKANSRRYFKQGDTFPAIENGAYGDTFWQWAPDQSAPSL